jgi:hypothetical protein
VTRVVNSSVLEGHSLMRILLVEHAISVNVIEKTQNRNIRVLRSVWLTAAVQQILSISDILGYTYLQDQQYDVLP